MKKPIKKRKDAIKEVSSEFKRYIVRFINSSMFGDYVVFNVDVFIKDEKRKVEIIIENITMQPTDIIGKVCSAYIKSNKGVKIRWKFKDESEYQQVFINLNDVELTISMLPDFILMGLFSGEKGIHNILNNMNENEAKRLGGILVKEC